MEEKMKALETKFDAMSSVLIDMQKHSSDSFAKIDENFEVIKNILNSHSNSFGDVEGKLDELHTEVKKIQKVSNYQSEYENLLKIVK